jgi:hypothetical protein
MREYLINADFDLSLRPGWTTETIDRRARQAGEVPYHLCFLGTKGDSVLVEEELDSAFLAYLERAALPPPRTTVLPSLTTGARLVPFGWNEEAAELNDAYASPAVRPSLEVVRRVNGRRFASLVERELLGVDECLGVFETGAEVEACIGARPDGEEWLIKSEHGNAGLGNRRVRSSRLGRSDRELIRRLLNEDVCVILETWRRRVIDISSVFEIEADGSVSSIEVYEVVNTADGAYLGSIFDHSSDALEGWRAKVTELAETVARRLVAEGYFGPVCLDHFVWEKNGKRTLRPLADLNARLQMSAPFLCLWDSWGRDRVLYWRLFSSRKLRVPSSYGEFEAALGRDAFDPETRRGVLVTSPFQVGGKRLRRIGVLLSANSRPEVERLDRRLRAQFDR